MDIPAPWHPTNNVIALKGHIYMVKYNYWTPSARWQNFVTVLFFGTKIPMTEHQIMLHVKGRSRTSTNCVHVSWQLGTNWISALLIWQSGSGTRIFVCALQWKADILNTDPVAQNVVVYNSIVYQTFLLNFINFCLFVQRLKTKGVRQLRLTMYIKHSRVQSSADDLHVLFLAVYRNCNSEQRILLKFLDLKHDQNLTDCSFGHAPSLQQMSSNFVHNCLSKVADRQTNGHGKNITSCMIKLTDNNK